MSALGKMMLDHKRGLDVLSETRGVDPARLGVAGHSLGGHNALMLAAFDERVQACVASCAFTRFADDQTPERWAREEGFVYLPNLRPHIERGEYPFDWEHVLALAAPTPIQLLTAKNDDCFSNTDSVEKAVKKARRIYKLLGKPHAIDNHVHDQGHRMTPDLLDAADTWFERWL
jgi:pimeloyl-ACP methyl ester carboxylesterase